MCEIETVCLIYGILNVLGSSLGLLGAAGMLIYVNVMVASYQIQDSVDLDVAVSLNVILGVALCALLIPFAFSVVLVKGIVQKKAGLLKVYFCYSVITKSLVLVGVLVGTFKGQIEWEGVLILAILSALYGLVLWMIILTYKKIEFTSQYDRTKLVEHKY